MNSYPPSSVTGLAEHAIDYAQRGWKVIPLNWIGIAGRCSCGKPNCSAGKHPFYKFAPSGVSSATNDVGLIRQWWSQHPQMNIGIATGPESGIAVLDVDVNDGKPGVASLQKLISDCGIAIPSQHQVEARSGSGGMHYYFRFPAIGVGNRVNLPGYPGLDFKGAGGYIVVPPSANANGEYKWTTAHGDSGAELPEVPDFLLQLIQQERSSATGTVAPVSWDGELPTSVALLASIPAVERSLVKRDPTSAPNDSSNSGIDHVALIDLRAQEPGLLDWELQQALLWSWDQNGLDRSRADNYFSNTIAKARQAAAAKRRAKRSPIGHQFVPVLRRISAGDWGKASEPASPVVEGLLYKGWLTNLAGNAKVGKSWLSLQLISAVLEGKECLGLPTTSVPVLHVCFEMHAGMIKERFCHLEKSLSLRRPEIGADYTLIANELSKPPLVLDLAQEDHVEALRHEINDTGAGLVVLDTLYRFTGEIDPNTPTINIVFTNLSNLARERNCAILTLDHTRKEGASTKPTAAAFGSAFKGGASSLNALLLRCSDNLWELSTEGYTDQPLEVRYRRPPGGFGCERMCNQLNGGQVAELFKKYGKPQEKHPNRYVLSKTALAEALRTEKIECNKNKSFELAQKILDQHCPEDNSGEIKRSGKSYVLFT